MKTGNKMSRVGVVFAVGLAVTFASIPQAQAATAYWTGLNGGNWSTTASTTNWSSSASSPYPPYAMVSGDSLRWFASSDLYNRLSSTNDIVGLSVLGISFQGVDAVYTLNGYKLTLTGNITQPGAYSHTFNLPMELNLPLLQITGATGANTLTFNGDITQTGGTRDLTIISGTAAFYGANSFSGTLKVGNGSTAATLYINTLKNITDLQSLGQGAVLQLGDGSGANGTLIYNGTVSAVTDKKFKLGRADGPAYPNTATIRNNSASGTITWNGAQDFTGVNNVSGAQTKTLALGGANTGDNTWAAEIKNNSDVATFVQLIAFTKEDAGKWILSGNNTYDGPTVVSDGKLVIAGDQSGATGTVTVAGGTLQLGNGGTAGALYTGSAISVSNGAFFAVNRSDAVTQGVHFSTAAITGAGGFTQAGTGTTVLNAANTYAGATTVSNGTLTIVGDHSGATGAVTVAGGTLQLGNGGTAGVLYTGSVISVSSGASFAVNRSDSVTQGVHFATAPITGAGGFTKTGTGRTVLNAANSYTGPTAVSNGTLVISGNQSGASGAVTVSSGATLGGSGSIGGLVSVPSGATLAVTIDGATADKLTITGTLTLAGNLNITHLSAPSSNAYLVATASSIATNGVTVTGQTQWAPELRNSGTELWIAQAAGVQLSVSDAATTELDTGASNTLVFTVSLDTASGSAVSFQYGTADGTATLADNDYLALTGSITLPAGQTSTNLAVTIPGDDWVEANETFTLMISNATGAVIADAQGIGTVSNNDARTISIGNVSVTEGTTNTTTNATFAITLSGTVGTAVTFDYGTANHTATNPGDYTAASGSITLPAGATSTNVTVVVNGDNTYEGNETFYVVLSNVTRNVTFSQSTGTCTIVEDDPVPPAIAVWDGATSGWWSQDNWSGGNGPLGAPLSGTDSLRWGGGSTANKTSTNDIVGLAVTSISFQSAPAGIVLNGNKVTLLAGAINQGSAGPTLNVPLELSANMTIDGGAGASVLTINGDITETGGTRGVNIQSGNVALNGANTYSGSMILGVTAGDSTLSINTLANTNTAQSLGKGALIQLGHDSGNGTIIFTGNGGSTDKGFQISRDTGTSTGTGGFINNGSGAVVWAGAQTKATSKTILLTFTLGGTNTATNTWQSVIDNNSASGLIGLTKIDSGKWILSDNNLYDGPTTVSNGTLVVAGDQSGATGTVTVAGGTLQLGNGGTVGALHTGSSISVSSGAFFVVNRSDAVTQGVHFSTAAITGAGGFTQAGTGRTVLNAANSYTGPTAVSNGMLVINGNQSAATGAVTVSSGATLGGTGVVGGAVSVPSGATLAVAINGATADKLTIGGALTLAGNLNITHLSAPSSNEYCVATAASIDITGLTVTGQTGWRTELRNGNTELWISALFLSVGDAATTELDSGASNTLVFTVSLDAASGSAVTFDYSTADGTATAADNDYLPLAGSITLPAGQTSTNLAVTLPGDDWIEGHETLTLSISNATGALIADAQGMGTISNNDARTVSIGNVSVTEGATSTTTNATFTVTLSGGAIGTDVTFDYGTANHTATNPGDYTAASGSATIPAGAISTNITVVVNGDNTYEGNETFYVVLSNVTRNATFSQSTGTCTIVEDDAPPAQLSVNDAATTEADSGASNTLVFTVALDVTCALPVTFDYSTADGTATLADNDYLPLSGSLTIPAGELSTNITVTIPGDDWVEANETFTLTISNATGAVIADAQGIGTISNNDARTISIDNVSVTEGTTNTTTNATFAITLSGTVGTAVTFDYGTANHTATNPGDYAAASGSITLPAGATSTNVTVVVNGDTTYEGNETFYVVLSNLTRNATFSQSTGTCTIVEDDPVPAAIASWDGATSGWWSQDNWSGGNGPLGAPLSGTDSLRWGSGSTANKVSTNDIVGLSVTAISFQGAPSGIVLNGNKVTLVAPIVGSSTIGSSSGSGAGTINLPLELNAATIVIGGSGGDTITINGQIAETGGSRAVRLEQGNITLTGTNNFSGSVQLGYTAAGGSATANINTLGNIGVSQSLGTGTLVTVGFRTCTGTLIYTGGATSTDKGFAIGENGASGSAAVSGAVGRFINNGTGAVVWTGPQTKLAQANDTSRTFTLGGTNTDTNTWQSVIDNNTGGTIGLTKIDSGKWILSGNNTYDGPTTVSNGTLVVAGNQSGATGAVTVAGGTLQLGNGGTAGALHTNSAISVSSGAFFVVNRSDAVTQGVHFSTAAITGAGGFTQAGTGRTVLNAANSYTGPTAVSNGTLVINGDQSGATGAVTVASGATLGGTGSIGGSVTVLSGATLAVTVGGATADKLTLGGTLTLAGNLNVTQLSTPSSNAYCIATATAIDATGVTRTGDLAWTPRLRNGNTELWITLTPGTVYLFR